MRHERLYLDDIVEAADHVADFIAGADFNESLPSLARADCRYPRGGLVAWGLA
jgi:hypothetical protein